MISAAAIVQRHQYTHRYAGSEDLLRAISRGGLRSRLVDAKFDYETLTHQWKGEEMMREFGQAFVVAMEILAVAGVAWVIYGLSQR